MINFTKYYRTEFREDINKFFSTIPDESRFHEDIQTKKTFAIQYERLTIDFDHLKFLTMDDKVNFGVALFFTVLIDMICYSHFKLHYEKFRKITLYPKFIGNCPGGCHYHFHPNDIFTAMNCSRKKPIEILSKERLEFSNKFDEAIPMMEQETKSLFTELLPEIDGQQFWIKCKAEFPYKQKEEKKN